MWRKSRSTNVNTTCIGVDLNRNWAFKWEGDGFMGYLQETYHWMLSSVSVFIVFLILFLSSFTGEIIFVLFCSIFSLCFVLVSSFVLSCLRICFLWFCFYISKPLPLLSHLMWSNDSYTLKFLHHGSGVHVKMCHT